MLGAVGQKIGESMPGRWKCPHCKEVFEDFEDFRWHVKDEHRQESQ